MPRHAEHVAQIDEYQRVSNQARFLEETSHGLFELLQKSKKNKAWLSRRLGCGRPAITKAFEGSNNFKLETLADISLALGRAVHVVWGVDLTEMRFPRDESEDHAIQHRAISSSSIRVDHEQKTITVHEEQSEGDTGPFRLEDYSTGRVIFVSEGFADGDDRRDKNLRAQRRERGHGAVRRITRYRFGTG